MITKEEFERVKAFYCSDEAFEVRGLERRMNEEQKEKIAVAEIRIAWARSMKDRKI